MARVDWSRYGPCSCGAAAGEVCIVKTINGKRLRQAKPHIGRPTTK